jgi:hypothetical protein
VIDYQRVENLRDQVAEKFACRCPELIEKLVALFREAQKIDKERERVNSTAPHNEHRRLACVELHARGLTDFAPWQPSISKTIRLPEWEESDRLAWPPPTPSFAATYATTMVPPSDPRYSADWWKFIDQNNAERAKITQRRQQDEEQRQLESRRAYEASLRRGV